MLDKASISWSWGIAHLARNCSPRWRVLLRMLQIITDEKCETYDWNTLIMTLSILTCRGTDGQSKVLTWSLQSCTRHFGMCIFQTQIQELHSHKQLTGSPRANNAHNINKLIMQTALICLFNDKLFNNKSLLQ